MVVLPVSRHFFVRKVSRNSQTTKSLEIMTFQGILLFLLFLDTFHIQGDLSFPLFPDTSTELSAAGAKRGVCKCIRTTILSRPAGQGLVFSNLYRTNPMKESRNGKSSNISLIFTVQILCTLQIQEIFPLLPFPYSFLKRG